MEELQKQIIAIQLIQELIVDVLNDNNVIDRELFEKMLKQRVDKFNNDIVKYSKEEENKNKKTVVPFINGIVGEA
jgi:hypothetical protein